jgi:hypothetical protein
MLLSEAEMDELIEACSRYIEGTLGVKVRIKPWPGGMTLPLHLREQYHMYETSLLNRPVVLMLDRGRGERSPGVVKQQMEAVRSKWVGEVVYVRAEVTAYNRSRLIGQKVSFVVPGNQLYLPAFGFDLREHFRNIPEELQHLSPSAQALLLTLLYSEKDTPVTPTMMAKRLGYTAMSMTRAFSELRAFGIGEHVQRGKNRELRLVEPKRKVWEETLPYLRSPVKQKWFVVARGPERKLPKSGLSALAEYTRIAPPSTPVYAAGSETWKAGRYTTNKVPVSGPDVVEIEVWFHSPELFLQTGIVDRLSLYLSLRETEDERTEQALRQMMEGVPW